MSNFTELAAAAEANPAEADFAALRQAYMTYEKRSVKHISQQKLMQITNHVTDFAEVARTCQSILEGNPMDLEARMMLAVAQEKAGNSTLAEKNHLFAERLIDAILATRDGKSFETAWKLVSDMEAWTIMRVFGMKAKHHTRHQREDGIFDVYEGVIGDRNVTLYFDVTNPARFIEENVIGELSE